MKLALTEKCSPAEILRALIANNGNLSKSARDLNTTTVTLKKNIERNMALRHAYEQFTDEIVDEAIDAMRECIRNGNTSMIQFALDRLGHNRGFSKRSRVTVEGNPDNPVIIEKKYNLDKLSLEEKRLLLQVANRELQEVIDVECVEDNDELEESEG